MKEEGINNFYLKSFIIIIVSTLLALFGLHYIQFILILFPVLFVSNIIKDGLNEGITNMIVTIIIISIVESIKIGIFLAITFLPFTIIISTLIKKRKNNTEILGFSSLTFFVSILIMFIIINLLGIDVVKYIESTFKQIVDMQLETIENIDLSNYEIFTTKQLLEDTYQYLLLIIPSLVLILSTLVSYINYLLSSMILKRVGINIVNISKFAKFRLPNNVVLGTIIMFGLTFLSGQLGFTYYETVFINIGVLISMGLFIQGLSVIDHLLNKLKLNIIFKLIFYITFIFSTSLVSIVTIVGLVDLIFDLRKLRKKKSH
ncbi:MAG: DUF2232 domain-containing protein [Tissierella sp.]|uniref:DUF2232 domain-containing protein n=1 Tax=Tissierella sp. TaxID=41274 RepID=UPI003F99E862